MPLKPSAIEEHAGQPEVVDHQLGATPEQVRQRDTSLVGVEPILLVHPYPRELLPPTRHFIASAGELLFGREQIDPCR
jgi:hypothetical protein